MAKSILIVDDEPMARTLLRLMLVRSGYEVIEAVEPIGDETEQVTYSRKKRKGSSRD